MNLFKEGAKLLKTVAKPLVNFFSKSSDTRKTDYKNTSSDQKISNINRDPDKVRIAELNKQTELDLKNKDKELINTKKEATLEIIKANEDMKTAIEEAKAQGMIQTAKAISQLQNNLNHLTAETFQIVEHISLDIIKEIENFYKGLEKEIEEKDIEYFQKKLPLLHEKLNEIDEESPLHEVFIKRIDQDFASHIQLKIDLITRLNERREMLLKSHIDSKNKMIENNNTIIEKIVEKYSLENYNDDNYDYIQDILLNENNQLEKDDNRLIEGND
ncbi:hypothetical protein SAMN04488598_14511 [Halanaerobium congolense]|uniref:Uncharacterized protein n=1 Tax=Halanaerobium congolense TaxID=54121 RepID=A0A1I0CIU9_9FIRM|nr:hypothetical protein [Halanaerobium congolense]PTX14833.1 hypothetical protein C7953_2899 [Halanaerobium congolense]SDG08840.1 hypothetical protein SAMN04488598_14511 [Halanaerobium congolense]SET19086.1 hypothetical protein SAMN04515652_13711 [Halanaerobium congolense]SFP80280.1 hypothetical protein SAMN04488596_1671 [Halanaerobium congolense]